MSELINKLNQYRSIGDKFYPEDILVIEDVWELLDEIERLNNIIKEAKKYIQDYFYIDKETGEYYFTHTFDKCNVGELLEILGSDKE